MPESQDAITAMSTQKNLMPKHMPEKMTKISHATIKAMRLLDGLAHIVIAYRWRSQSSCSHGYSLLT